MTATDHSVSETLRPDWTPDDGRHRRRARRPTASRPTPPGPRWSPPLPTPAATGGNAEQLLTTAHDLLRSGQPDHEPLRPDELATALVWRIGMLTDTAACRT